MKRLFKTVLPWLDTVTLGIWGALFLKLLFTGQFRLLIHPNYAGLVLGAGIILVGISLFKAWQLWQSRRRKIENSPQVQHITIFPPGWSTLLLLVTAILGLSIPPRVLASDTALQRGVTEALPVTQTQRQSFRGTIAPEDRSIVEWVRTLNAYPEPDAYAGQKVNVTGFVVRNPEFPDDYVLLCRFIITCCAVDASPVGLPVKLSAAEADVENDTWLQIEGEMMTETINGKRQLAIAATNVEKIPTPADPYKFAE
ncbi:MAG: TIGR03943 family protein [Jaaginema sp. PMC 1079.18]|nr:TIGR03943 family protein [Jaaginema sp. PMC 1080.18]MEC4851768.1 TIGR03943 family protein [Jaaginema sp. PMC 1079.18]MEC4864522.1 TIGR03943 family protein [Jaaginema sp. PMC 1078.18]